MSLEMFNEIIPYVGIGPIKLGMTLEEVRTIIKAQKMKFDQWIDPNEWCEPSIPWTLIRIEKAITMVFVKGILFEIGLEESYIGSLPNGIHIGMPMSEVEKMEPNLKYNEDDEEFESPNGYWIGDEIASGKVVSITIFLPDVELDSDEFFKYEWLEKYLQK